MQSLQTLVRNLAVILLLATFLEMMLPNKSMRGYVQLVMGLFVISALLNPITSFLHTPLSMEIPAWTTTSQQDLPVLAPDSAGTRLGRDIVVKQYKQILVHQIEALTLGVKGVEGVSVEITFNDQGEGLTDQPEIGLVSILLAAGKETVKPVQPIIIGGNPGQTQATEPSALAQEVQERISELMEIPKEKIVVKEA